MRGQGCGKTVLARGPCAEVTRCTCGHLHLAMGPVTIRMEEEVLRATCLTLLEALQALDPSEPDTDEEAGPAAPRALASGGWKQ